MSEIINVDEKKYISLLKIFAGDQEWPKMTQNDSNEQKMLQNQWKSCQILWKLTKFSQLDEYLAPRVFEVRQKQNIIGPSTRRDLSISGTISWKETLFNSTFWT